MITPREMLRDYMTVLNILMQNPDASFEQVVGSAVTLRTEQDDDAPGGNTSANSNGTPSGTAPRTDSSSGGAGARFSIDDIEF